MRCRLIDLSPISCILFAKLAPFTPEEIALARTLNGEYRRRVILLTARELEPEGNRDHGPRVSPDELAAVTGALVFHGPSDVVPSGGGANARAQPRGTVNADKMGTRTNLNRAFLTARIA
jgi:hypothetical protein